jgi:hypothetical protein
MPTRSELEAQLASLLTGVYSTRHQITGLLDRAGLQRGSFYPETAETAREAWPVLLVKLRTASVLDTVLRAVLADEQVVSIHAAVRKLLQAAPAPAEAMARPTPAAPRDAATVLLCETVLRGAANDARALARKLLDAIVRERIPQAHLFDAARLAIEFHLLLAEDVGPAQLLELTVSSPLFGDDDAPSFRACLQKARENGFRFHEVTLQVDSHTFFTRARTREPYWRDYFVALSRTSGTEALHLATCCVVRVQGFVVPQFLVAGLLARFDDDWRRVIGVYRDQTNETPHALGRLQASQWNTWLMWGPSIPLCTCGEWHGLSAFQLGYGDESNSLPLLGEADGMPRSLDAASVFQGARAPAVPLKLSGRLRWGPSFLRLGVAPDEAPREDSADDLRPSTLRLPAARAQRAIYEVEGTSSSSGGLVFQGDERTRRPIEGGAYFSAYLWMMFLVARRNPAQPVLQRLADRFPPVHSPVVDRRGARLWRELLPVFVHANIADETALRMQKRALAEAAVCLLRQVWEQRDAILPEAPDELSFHLVATSDYPGCGHALRLPPVDSLLDGLRRRLGTEPDLAFVQSVSVPSPKEAAARPDYLERFYSACHLPELVTDYYAYMDDLRRGKTGRFR